MKKVLLLTFITLVVINLKAQFAYRTVASGNWNANTTWERFDPVNSTWSAATIGQTPGALDSVFIQQGHTLTLTQAESCFNLAIQNASGIRLNLSDNILTINGTIAAFSNPVGFSFPVTYTATINFSIQNGTNGAGVIRFVGNTRNLFNSGQWGANPASWNCQFALNQGAVGTLPGNFKAGRIIVSSGSIIANNDLRPDQGSANSGDILIASGASLRINGNISRTATLTNAIDSVDIFGILELGGTSASQTTSLVNLRVNTGGKLVKINNNALVANITNRTWSVGSTLEYAGTSNQIVGGEFTNTVPKVVINNSGTGAAVNFPFSRYISDSLVMSSGNITIGANDSLTLGVSSTGTLIYNSGTIIGKFNRFISNTTTGNILFPVGSASFYRPLNANFISAPVSGGNVSITHVDNGVSNITISPFIDAGLSVDRISQSYWAGSINNGLLATNITISCTMDGQGGVQNSSSTRIVGTSDNGLTYGSLGGTHVSGTGVTATRSGFQVNSPLNFRLHLGGNSISNPLPVQFKVIESTRANNSNLLKWTTATETNNSGFEVQRSVNNGKYEVIGFVKGAGNSRQLRNYSFTDAAKLTGNVCYRLRQIDFNGNSELSKSACVNISEEKITTEVLPTPNPFNNSLQLNYATATEGNAHIEVVDMLGKVQLQTNEHVNKGANSIHLNTETLPLGIYFLRVSQGSEVLTKRIVKK